MSRRATLGIAAGIAALLAALLTAIVGLPLMFMTVTTAQAAQCGNLPVGPPGVAHEQWDGRQVANATTIVGVGKQLQVPPRGYVIAVATAMQESTLLNHANDNDEYPEVKRISLALPHEDVGHDHDSVGLFQQRPDEGEAAQQGRTAWGPVKDLMTPAISAQKFYAALLKVDGWEQMRLTDAAQAVQRSGTPEAYQEHEAAAEALAAHVLGLPDIDVIGGGAPSARCGPGQFGPVPVGPNGWVQPLDLKFEVGGVFGENRGDHYHAGVDIVGANIRNEPIRSVADGAVIRVVCDSGSGTCDRDGGSGVGGCGWYADIRHPGNVVTRYCHMVRRPFVQEGQAVTAGQVVGQVGSSGNSSGPHLHFEVHTNVAEGERLSFGNAVDPERFMAAQQAPLPT
jgi:murein DD-endopeptidase MepM/ murein hydrolase activator NlpD